MIPQARVRAIAPAGNLRYTSAPLRIGNEGKVNAFALAYLQDTPLLLGGCSVSDCLQDTPLLLGGVSTFMTFVYDTQVDSGGLTVLL